VATFALSLRVFWYQIYLLFLFFCFVSKWKQFVISEKKKKNCMSFILLQNVHMWITLYMYLQS
jgi:hypothetical protein